MIRSCGSHRYHKSRFGQGLRLLPEIVKSVAALKLLQPAPLCVQIDGRVFCRDRFHLSCERGGSLKRLHPGVSGHVTGMALPMGIRKVPKEMTVGSSIGPTASEFRTMS